MKVWKLAALLCLTTCAFGQSYYQNNAYTTTYINGTRVVSVVSGAKVRVCSTISGACTQVAVYPTSSLGTPLTQPITPDGQGNFGFWIPTGSYSYRVLNAQNVEIQAYPFTVGGGTGGSGTVTNLSTGSWPTWLTPSVSNPSTTPSLAVAASSIPNSALANSTMTINSTACTLGGSCTIAGGGGGVATLNSLAGALNIVAGSNVTVTPSGSSITIAATGTNGLSGQTAGYYPKATTATTAIGPGIISDDGSTATVHGDLNINSITGSTQCLHVNSSGTISGSGADCGTGGGGSISGQTINYLPKATSSTASTISSAVEDTGSSLVYHGTGTQHGIAMPSSSGGLTAPAVGTAGLGTDSSGTWSAYENGGSWSRLCTVGNGLCGGGGSMVYPAAGIPNSTGSAWGTSYSVSGTGNVALTTSPTFVTPALGTPSAAVLTNATGLPLTTGVAGTLPVANGGTGTTSPGIVAGTNVSVTGSWPNQTVNSTATASTAFSAVTGSTNTTAAMVVGSGASIAPTGTGTITANGPSQTALIVVAASNSINKASANYIATGTNDQTTIQTAINACPATLPASAGPAQCTVVLQPGVYNVGATVTIDTDDVTLTGEGQCMWGGFNAPWSSTASPNGTIGTGCSQLKASATGFPLITIAHSNQGGTGSADANRHRGIAIRKLYLVGNSYLNSGIVTIGNGGTCNTSFTYNSITTTGCYDDNVAIEENVIQRMNLGINVLLDTPLVRGNSIQDNNGDAEHICGVNARVTGELNFDNAGQLITACAINGTYIGNTLGDTQTDAIHVYVDHTTVTANTFSGVKGSAIYVEAVPGTAITGNVINYTSTISGYNTNGQLPTSANAIHVVAGATGTAITGNSLDSGLNETGYAINALGTAGSVQGNAVRGTWRFGSTPTTPISVNVSNATVSDSGNIDGPAFDLGSTAGFKAALQDSAFGNKPSYNIASGLGYGVSFLSSAPSAGLTNIPVLQFMAPGIGASIDFFNYLAINSDATNLHAWTKGAGGSSVERLRITGNTATAQVQVLNADLSVSAGQAISSGSNVLYRCTTAGTLPIGALTINTANCGATADTGLRVN